MKSKKKTLIELVLLLIILFSIRFIMLDKGSFEKLILSNLENYDFCILDITYLTTKKYSRDDSENIKELIDYLKTLELKEVEFTPSNNEPYYIRITGYEDLKRGSIHVEVINSRYITADYVKKDTIGNSEIVRKNYKITNKDFDYDLLIKIMRNMPIPK